MQVAILMEKPLFVSEKNYFPDPRPQDFPLTCHWPTQWDKPKLKTVTGKGSHWLGSIVTHHQCPRSIVSSQYQEKRGEISINSIYHSPRFVTLCHLRWGWGAKKKKKISSELYEYCKNLKPSYCKLFLILKKWASRRTILEKKNLYLQWTPRQTPDGFEVNTKTNRSKPFFISPREARRKQQFISEEECKLF